MAQVEERVYHEDVHHDHGSSEGSNSMWGLIILLIVLVLFFVYGLPALRSMNTGPQINVPGQIDVNIHQPTK